MNCGFSPEPNLALPPSRVTAGGTPVPYLLLRRWKRINLVSGSMPPDHSESPRLTGKRLGERQGLVGHCKHLRKGIYIDVVYSELAYKIMHVS